MSFTDRDTYLAYRAEWKLNYARISHEIRLARGFFKASNRAFSKVDGSHKTYAALSSYLKTMAQDRRDLYRLRDEANLALIELINAKEEARRQWELAHPIINIA